ncbi:MAG: (deoxy)nucleoside triphosphate pyrophosphohydrolase, partial [Candidatus Angelobacter sp.]
RYSPESQVELQFFLVEQFEREIQNRIFLDVRWVEKQELPTYKFLQADIKLVQQLAAGKLL